MSITGIEIGGGIEIGSGIQIGVPVGFTIGLADITNSNTFGSPQPILDSPSQFTVQAGNNLGNAFYFTPTPDAAARITAAFASAGFDIQQPYAWYVSWAVGGSGIARFEYYPGGQVNVMPVDTTVANWQTNNVYSAGSALAGTFAFPATFTPYAPPTQLGNRNQWC